ncbi:type II secretion system protein [Cohnella sp. 56]|uniref:type II secretion system protein n=1 Tax=Cohnella sp. 56 TaxID=3113722 RepID=UPI0030E85D8C
MRTAVMKRLGKAKEDQKGFTLIELLAVIVILAVIAAIAVPLIGNIINKSKKDSDISTARQIYDAARLYITSEENGVYPVKTTVGTGRITIATLQEKGYLDKGTALPSTKKLLVGTNSFLQFDSKGLLEEITLSTGNATGETVTYSATKVLSVNADASEPAAPAGT